MSKSTGRSNSSRSFWLLGMGYCAWASALVLIYGLHGIGCAFAWPDATIRLCIAAILVFHLAIIGWQWYRHTKGGPDLRSGKTGAFLHWALLWTLVTASATTVVSLGPTLLVRVCG